MYINKQLIAQEARMNRENAKLTLKNITQLTGLDSSLISKFETGKIQSSRCLLAYAKLGLVDLKTVLDECVVLDDEAKKLGEYLYKED